MKYRPDIDGLRAIAILAVLGFHAAPGIFPGGFLGVDVFFVISGFLISSILLDHLDRGRFSITVFYQRRIRRIFPALLLLMPANLAVGWFILFPDEFRALGKHVAGGTGFISNLVLYSEAGYFDAASEFKPLLHLWSLGIEEQFYILWPLALWLIWKVRWSFTRVMMTGAALSFLANLWAVGNLSAAAVFYLPVYRFWELLMGGILAYVVRQGSFWKAEKDRWSEWLAPWGGVLILVGVFVVDGKTPVPGFAALLPTAGSFLLLSQPRSWFNRRILSSRFMVYIGLISYPLYLWHWSLISYLHILEMDSSAWLGGSLLVSLLLSVLTYELVEKWIKRQPGNGPVGSLVAISVVTVLVGLLVHTGQIPPRNDSVSIEQAVAAMGEWEFPEGLVREDVAGYRAYRKGKGSRTILFTGDSHMEQYAPRIRALLDQNQDLDYRVVFMTEGGCPPIPGVYEDLHPRCNQSFRQAVTDFALSEEVEAVVLAASWHRLLPEMNPGPGRYRYHFQQGQERIYFDQGGTEPALEALESYLIKLADKKQVFLILPIPTGEQFHPRNQFTGNRLQGFEYLSRKFSDPDSDQRALRRRMREMGERAGVQIIDPVEAMAVEGKHPVTMAEGLPIYKDDSHLRPIYVREQARFLDVIFR